DRAVAGELDHVAPAAAAGIEDARARGQAQPFDRALDHAPAAAIPPVAVLGAVGLQLVVPVHAGPSFPKRLCAAVRRRARAGARARDSGAAAEGAAQETHAAPPRGLGRLRIVHAHPFGPLEIIEE